MLKTLFVFFFEEYIKFIEELDQGTDLIFQYSAKSYLINFINYLDIFINEIRKFDIACGAIEFGGFSINLKL